MRKLIGIALILATAGIDATAQNERDAFRYAQYSPTGSARYAALSGSMGAFGSDFMCLSAGNPAGIGLFKRFEFSLTPMLSYSKNMSTYNGEQRKGTDYSFNLNNLGVVLVFHTDTTTKWKSVQFATGYNNLARYDGAAVVSGSNGGTTNFLKYLAQNAEGINYNSLEQKGFIFEFDAWNNFLLNTLSGTDNSYSTPVDAEFDQLFTKKTRGYLNEYIFSFGGNYDDKLFLGATVGIPFFRYEEERTYTESYNPFYDTLIYRDDFISKATGVNLKLGIIYQPVRFLRLGAAFHTPTKYFNVNETYSSSFEVWSVWSPLDSNYHDIYDTKDGEFNYALRTPYHATANIAFIFKNRGFINIDYEYVDYAQSEFEANSYDFGVYNKNIKKYYTGTHTVRVGGELNLSPIVFRAGGSYSTNPYKEVEKDGSLYTVSGGIGYKSRIFFADFAYMYRFCQDKDIFYNHASLNPYASKITNQFFVLTLGWKLKM